MAQKAGASSLNRYLINMGEKITSLRQILRRDVWIDGENQSIDVSAFNLLNAKISSGRYPPLYGFDTNGYSIASNAARINYCSTPPFNWISMMYIGMRGSVNWNYNISKTGIAFNDVRMWRANVGRTTNNFFFSGQTTALSGSNSSYFYANNNNDGASGQTITHQLTQSGVAVNIPFYSQYLFNYTNPANRNLGIATDGSDADTFFASYNITPISSANNSPGINVQRFFSIGPDFTFFMFLCCPSFYTLNTIPTSS